MVGFAYIGPINWPRKHTKGLNMKLKVDKESDALKFRLDDSTIIRFEEVQPSLVLDFDDRGRVLGVEMMRLIERVRGAGILSTLQSETG